MCMVFAKHPQAGDLPFLLREHHAAVGVFRLADPVDGHRTALSNMDLR